MDMETPEQAFTLFGPPHLLIIAMIPVLAAIMAWAARRNPATARWLRIGLGSLLILNELAWYVYLLYTDGIQFPDLLPLQLCDVTLWVTAITCFTLKPGGYEFAYYAGIAGSGMAVITPDVWMPLLSYPTIHFFLAHGGAVIAVLFLTWADLARPRLGSVLRVFLYMNIFAALVGAFNFVFKTNYMYLCQKPAGASLLDYFGPWPFYILGGEVLTLALFTLLWLPVKKRSIMVAHQSP